MVRFRRLVLALPLLLVLPAVSHASSNPIPGVGIVVKRNPGSSTAFVVPGGFLGAGSAPFAGTVGLKGRCSFECGGCDTDCGGGPPDTRLDYSEDTSSGPFDVSMGATTLYSTDPIAVDVGGSSSFFDVFVTLSGPGPLADDPVPGTFTLPSGSALDLATSSTVASSSLDLHASITFADHTTGIAAGSSLEEDLHLDLLGAGLPVARVADGTATGHVVMGGNGATVTAFTYANAGGGLRLQMLSLEAGAPVPVHAHSWGALKSVYR